MICILNFKMKNSMSLIELTRLFYTSIFCDIHVIAVVDRHAEHPPPLRHPTSSRWFLFIWQSSNHSSHSHSRAQQNACPSRIHILAQHQQNACPSLRSRHIWAQHQQNACPNRHNSRAPHQQNACPSLHSRHSRAPHQPHAFHDSRRHSRAQHQQNACHDSRRHSRAPHQQNACHDSRHSRAQH